MFKSPSCKITKQHELLRKIPFFSDLSSSELVGLEQLLKTQIYAKREIILDEEDTPNFMYIIFSGKVRVVLLSEEGKEHIITIHKRGDYFGEMSLFDGKTSPATVIAVEESEIGLLAKADFESFIVQNKRVLQLVAMPLMMWNILIQLVIQMKTL